jgi:cobalt-zinc-cadmium efflux system protein
MSSHDNHVHEHIHEHEHNHHRDHSGKNLLTSALLNLIIALVEVCGGIFSNSLSLLSDALHNFTDSLSVLLAFVANRFGKKQADIVKTFGYKRIEIIAALFNSAAMIMICLFLFYEAIIRIIHPEQVKGKLMLIVAIVCFLANLVAVIILKKDSHHNLNFKAAYLHLLGDTLTSLVVIAGAILINYFCIYWIDPLVTIIVSIYILKEAFSILKEAYQILMQSAPLNLDLTAVKKRLETISSIENIHHIHAWNLTDTKMYFECHVDLRDDYRLSQTTSIANQMRTILKEEFGVEHLTVQFEFNCCGDKRLIH